MSGVAHGTNRFIDRVDPSSAGGGGVAAVFAVQNVAALSALSTLSLNNGSEVAMRSILDDWALDRESVETPDGITVVAALDGGGNWVRKNFHSQEWKNRLVWYVDSRGIGNDEADGATALTALKTIDEIHRRTGGVANGAVINLVGAFYDGDINVIEDVANPNWPQVTINGSAPVVLWSGTMTGVTQYNIAGGVRGHFTDAAIPVDFATSGLVGKRLVLTSGPNAGAIAYVVASLAAKACWFSPFFDPVNQVCVDPAENDTYDVVSIMTVVGTYVHTGTCTAFINDLRFSSSTNYFFCAGKAWLTGCEFYGLTTTPIVQLDTLVLYGCYIANDPGSTVGCNTGSVLNLYGCALIDCSVSTYGGSSEVWDKTIIVSLTNPGAPVFFANEKGELLVEGGWLGIFDWAGGTSLVSLVDGSSAHFSAPVWGTGNATTYNFDVVGGCQLLIDSVGLVQNLVNTAPTFAFIGGVAKAYTDLPYANLNNLAAVALTQ